jgi:hypothetical protein
MVGAMSGTTKARVFPEGKKKLPNEMSKMWGKMVIRSFSHNATKLSGVAPAAKGNTFREKRAYFPCDHFGGPATLIQHFSICRCVYRMRMRRGNAGGSKRAFVCNVNGGEWRRSFMQAS